MALRSLVGMLKALPRRMPGSGAFSLKVRSFATPSPSQVISTHDIDLSLYMHMYAIR
jgi:hypothetical protein